MFAQVDDEGNRHVFFHEITYHRKTNAALDECERTEVLPNGVTGRKPTAKGWEILMAWKDGSTLKVVH
jgi:hypothetical protein